MEFTYMSHHQGDVIDPLVSEYYIATERLYPGKDSLPKLQKESFLDLMYLFILYQNLLLIIDYPIMSPSPRTKVYIQYSENEL